MFDPLPSWRGRFLAGFALTFIAGCSKSDAKQTAPSSTPDAGEELQSASLTATVGSTRFVAREHFLAAGEMQISGEPFAEAMGRDLGGYSRDHLPTDVYFDTSPVANGQPWIDLPGFSTGVESYEYSKQPMNNVAFESGAGTSLVYAPLVNPTGLTGAAATTALAAQVQHYAAGSNALNRFVFPPGTFPSNNERSGDVNPSGKGDPAKNPLGWPGIWPTTHVFRSFDPTIHPTSDIALACAISSDDDPGASGSLGCADYECDATSLHLAARSTQIEPVISPGADGFSAWKYGLWVLNYLQVMHDSTEAGVSTVDARLLANVGSSANKIVGFDDTGAKTAAGTFLGSSDIEGFQAQLFISQVENRAEDWLMSLTTTNGKTLSGFATLKDALSYDYSTPLRWFPGAVSVSETDDGSGFPNPSYALSSANSDLLDQIGLVLGFSEFYALTDTGNADVGGSQPAVAYFDGDPFPADNQKADGESTLHDRALGMLRVALINIDRLHMDPASSLLVDDVTMKGSAPTRGTTVATTSVAYTILGLRTALRSLSSQLELYSNNTPDTAIGGTPLDALRTTPPGGATSFSDRIHSILVAEGELLLNNLTTSTGQAWDGWDVVQGAPIDDQDLLDSHTAAVRGLFAAYLATGDVRYHDRALAVFNRMQSVFYNADARVYTATPAPADSVEYTPLRFALLQSALRDVYELVATRPGGEDLEPLLEARVSRLNKLVLNGWDDRNQNRLVDWPQECVNVVSGLPQGGLQMAERTLTGETGSLEEHLDTTTGQQRTVTSDREHDCVPEIDDANLPSALADSVTYTITRKMTAQGIRGSTVSAFSLLTIISCQSSHDGSTGGLAAPGGHSSAMAISADQTRLFAANPDADSVSVIDLTQRTLLRESLLAPSHPAPDPSSGNYVPAVMPRAVALSPQGDTLYVTGERSGVLYQVDVASGAVRQTVAVGSEPIGVLVSGDGASVFVACSQDSTVVRVDTLTAQVAATAHVPNEPWALAWAVDDTLLVTGFMGPGITAIEPKTMTVGATWNIPDMAPRSDKRLAHGQVRGLYDAALRPKTSEVWVAHALLGTDTPQPALDFESTAFPALSLLHTTGEYEQTLSSDAQDVPGVDGSFGDVVSGPQALAFTSDGTYALVVDANSEDVMIVNASQRIESSLVRPLPGDFPDGIVLSPDEQFAYVDERASNDVAVLRLDRSMGTLTAAVVDAPIAKLTADPMPADLRLGQQLFNSADSSKYPLTTDHWIACATCHMEGRSDAVTWKFAQGPRDTPTTAGGVLGTGFLFRTADRSKVQDYWHTINIEQGGRFDPTAQASLLDALTAYVNLGLPAPSPPTTDASLVDQGARVFVSSGCATCHTGPRFTDSGAGNPKLDLSGPILLHDVGTCVKSGSFPDVAHKDVDGNQRAACAFDTPSLTGLASSPPYLHDGSAATISDSVQRMPTPPSSADDLNALQEYLRSL